MALEDQHSDRNTAGKDGRATGKRAPEHRPISSFIAFNRKILLHAVSPILSLKDVRINRDSAGQALAFLLKVAALEVVRRGSLITCPALWMGIQGFSLLHAAPLAWIQRFPPLNYFVQKTQTFSKPLLLLSVATAVTSALEEHNNSEEHSSNNEMRIAGEQSHIEEIPPVGTLALCPTSMERDNVQGDRTDSFAEILHLLKLELENAGIGLPERMNDDELKRFLVVTDGNLTKSFSKVKRSIRWRQNFCFLTPEELENWSHLIFWHGYDIQLRPSLIIRLGHAYSVLKADEWTDFVQAIISQVEYGVMKTRDLIDPKITVIVDCEGVPAFGFPVGLMKACCVLVQENYPTRLAALYAVKLQPVIRVVAQAVIQVLRPATRKKVHFEGNECTRALVEYHGSAAYIPRFLGGNCSCSQCQRLLSINLDRGMLIMNNEQQVSELEDDVEEGTSDGEQQLDTYQTFNWVIRIIIVVSLIIWAIISFLAGFYDQDQEFSPT